jgi:DNA-binding protein HU-beta
MFKGVFIKQVARKNQKPQISQRAYNEVLNNLLAGIRHELAAGRKVVFPGFGTFYIRTHRGGTGLNFKTKKPVKYGPTRVAAFRPGTLLKASVRKKK